MTTAPWRDPALTAAVRVDDLPSRMTLEEKTAQLYGVWVGASTDGEGVAPHQDEKTAQLYGVWVGASTDGEGVAPHQDEMTESFDFDELTTRGLGQLTRSFGTA